MSGTYIYGIVSADHSAPPDGMEGIGEPPRRTRLVRGGGLAAVVSDAPDGLRPKRRDLLAHQNVLAQAGGDAAVLPMRFGSLAPDDDAVAAVLDERAEHYRERLRALDGKVEYNVKAQHDEEAVLHRVMAENAEIRTVTEANRRAGGGSHEEKLRLGEMVVAAVQAREAQDAVSLRRILEPAAEAVSSAPESTGWLANLSFLVDRKAAEHFLTAVETARGEHAHVELRVNGPLPPYSFVEPGPSEPVGTE
ncbi:GvpL/GvpF family gas vesicle protein [Streptomyces sp. NPDC049813]|uniref:GvpL/GvpF family gas vesicle protein n=1 Tax=Streptomyces sp. NPDC049813 TaxID=3365597 RepID=UPI003787B507